MVVGPRPGPDPEAKPRLVRVLTYYLLCQVHHTPQEGATNEGPALVQVLTRKSHDMTERKLLEPFQVTQYWPMVSKSSLYNPFKMNSIKYIAFLERKLNVSSLQSKMKDCKNES